MIRICILALVVPAIIATPFLKPRFLPPFSSKIVGGLPIGIEVAPHQVSLQLREFHICGGSVISECFILTAAHCTDRVSEKDLKVRAGSALYRSGGALIPVREIIQHEKFDFFTIDYDFSLLKLVTQLKISELIKPVALPLQNEEVPDNTLCLVTGWGNTQSVQESREKLRGAFVPSVNQIECNEAYNEFGGITDRMICAGFKVGQIDACQGDSGGPLVANNKLIGVVSWGYMCAKPNYPGVYSRVASVRNWIRQKSGV
jgi:trypsin